MKTLIVSLMSMMLAVSFSISAESENHAMGGCQDGQMMGMMDDPDAQAMMMNQIAGDPEMRHQMMQKMMGSMNMDMQQMMNSPQMKEMMQMHVEMMQAIMDPDGMDQAKMKEMMENPQMMEMMKLHTMNMQMMNGGMMGEHSTEDSEEHVH